MICRRLTCAARDRRRNGHKFRCRMSEKVRAGAVPLGSLAILLALLELEQRDRSLVGAVHGCDVADLALDVKPVDVD